MARGRLRVLLGAAPGVGKTYTMLEEGRRLHAEGRDVVVAIVETHGRAATAAMIADLEVVPRADVTHRGMRLDEMDLDAVLRRAPELALVDELAHTNAPGSRNEKRWQDVHVLLDAGIDVISTVNIQHIESLHDVVQRITGIAQRETIPDHVLREADTVEVVDLSPQALRDRLAGGSVYPAERIDAALSNYFRLGNLTALRELALLWLADEVDQALQRYRAEQGIDASWEARERVVVTLTGGVEGETLLRRGARIATRSSGGELLAVHVTTQDGLRRGDPEALARQRDNLQASLDAARRASEEARQMVAVEQAAREGQARLAQERQQCRDSVLGARILTAAHTERQLGEALKAATHDLSQLRQAVTDLGNERDALAQNAAEQMQAINTLGAELDRVYGSRSWRVTGPLRAVMSRFGGSRP